MTDEPLAKNLRSLKTCVSVNNNLESPTMFDENVISCELDNFTFKMVY